MRDEFLQIALQAVKGGCRYFRIGGTGGVELAARTESRDSILKRAEWAGVPIDYGRCRRRHVERRRKQRAALKLQQPHAVAPRSHRRRVELGNRALCAVGIYGQGADGYGRKTGMGGIV